MLPNLWNVVARNLLLSSHARAKILLVEDDVHEVHESRGESCTREVLGGVEGRIWMVVDVVRPYRWVLAHV